MLSEQLDSVAERFAEYQGGDVALDAQGVAWLVALFRDLADQAREMERHVVPGEARLTAATLARAAGDNVVAFDPARREAAAAPRRPSGDGGAA